VAGTVAFNGSRGGFVGGVLMFRDSKVGAEFGSAHAVEDSIVRAATYSHGVIVLIVVGRLRPSKKE
jgi:hypothetical protein